MTTETTHTAASAAHTENHAENHGMSNAGYVRIAAILAAITALEVSTVYVDFGPLFLPALLIMMAVKFIMVVSYFMHLKFDNKLFSFMFYAGLILAVGVYAAFLATFHFFIQ
ncbi:MAG: cytochrome C oxidase subunit IV [Actinobacteria bacterium]|nr:cytochrome C oxidase subunit IV [Actinomycetota bacterium]